MIDLKTLGMTKAELQDRVVNGIVTQALASWAADGDGEGVAQESALSKRLQKIICERIDKDVNAIAAKHVLPNVSKYIEDLTLQETNQWGEARGKPITFVEYLIQRAEAYLVEKVDSQGKTKGENSYGSWSGTQTRVTHMIHGHLHYSIESAMKEALKNANGAIAEGIAETCKVKLAEIAKSLTVEVKA